MSGQLWGGATYAQHGEDIVFCMIFDRLGIERPSYLDIGAYHPIDISNTALLYERGSSGVNVEPVPELLAAFWRHRPRDITLGCAVGPKRLASRKLYVGENRGLSSFMPELIACPVVGVIDVPVVKVSDILADRWGGAWPDLLSIDIEGGDVAVLACLPDSGDRPSVVCAEAQAQGSYFGSDLTSLMAAKRYRLFCRAHANMIFTTVESDGALFGV